MSDLDKYDGIKLPGRTLLPPTTISQQARDALEAGAKTPLPERPAVNDVEAWRAAQIAGKTLAEAGARRVLSDSQSTVNTTSISGVTVHIGQPKASHAGAGDPVYIYIHGGAFLFGEQWLAMASAAKYADRLGMTVVSIDHRMPPDNPYPIPAQDCLAVYRSLLKSYDSRKIALGGSSAGGNLALVTALMARDEGLALPAALVLISPEVDLTESGDSIRANELVDTFLKHGLGDCNAVYANGADLTLPYLSPLFADLSGLPPTFIQSGTRDLFLSSAAMLHRKMRKAGVAADLHVWEAMPHGGFSLRPGVPEDDEIDVAVRAFLQLHL